MRINVRKTKIMKILKIEEAMKIMIDGQMVEQVKKFKYLGAWITDDGRCDAEIRSRIAMVKDAFIKRKQEKGVTNTVHKYISKEENCQVLGLVCSIILWRNFDAKKIRYKKIGGFRNVDM